jgi:hypothetical protein
VQHNKLGFGSLTDRAKAESVESRFQRELFSPADDAMVWRRKQSVAGATAQRGLFRLLRTHELHDPSKGFADGRDDPRPDDANDVADPRPDDTNDVGDPRPDNTDDI